MGGGRTSAGDERTMGSRVTQTPVVDAASFRRALGRHAAGVVVVTGPGPVGLTATSLTSVSRWPFRAIASAPPARSSLTIFKRSSAWTTAEVPSSILFSAPDSAIVTTRPGPPMGGYEPTA